MNTISVSLDTNEQRVNTLRAVIDEGIQSGFHKDFDLDGHLAYLEDKYINNKTHLLCYETSTPERF